MTNPVPEPTLIHRIDRTIFVGLFLREEPHAPAPTLGVRVGAGEIEWFGNPQRALWAYMNQAMELSRTEPDFFISLGMVLAKAGLR